MFLLLGMRFVVACQSPYLEYGGGADLGRLYSAFPAGGLGPVEYPGTFLAALSVKRGEGFCLELAAISYLSCTSPVRTSAPYASGANCARPTQTSAQRARHHVLREAEVARAEATLLTRAQLPADARLVEAREVDRRGTAPCGRPRHAAQILPAIVA